jgi:16S rRNA (guanine1207-N2)-methyltransferase
MTHYFESGGSARPGRGVQLRAGDRTLELHTSGGVFARTGIDQGTQVLLDLAPEPRESGDLLDVGCGYGPIALTMAVRSPRATVWAVDVNERARELCARNARDAGLGNVRVHAPDEVPADTRFTTIWSNPPIRIGKDALHELLTRWLSALAPDGHAILVVQRNLGADSLHRWLSEQGWPTERIASRKGFRLLRCGALTR